jgi:hypothetical protein
MADADSGKTTSRHHLALVGYVMADAWMCTDTFAGSRWFADAPRLRTALMSLALVLAGISAIATQRLFRIVGALLVGGGIALVISGSVGRAVHVRKLAQCPIAGAAALRLMRNTSGIIAAAKQAKTKTTSA